MDASPTFSSGGPSIATRVAAACLSVICAGTAADGAGTTTGLAVSGTATTPRLCVQVNTLYFVLWHDVPKMLGNPDILQQPSLNL